MEDRLHDCRPGRSLYGRFSGVHMLLWEYRGDLAVANLGGSLSGYLLVAIHVASPQLSNIKPIISKLFQGLLNTPLTNWARHLA